MRVADHQNDANLDQGKRPVWTDTKAYQNHLSWSYRRWAWEFLRRNAKYQAACRLLGPRRKTVSLQFGRVNLKQFKASYGNDDDYRYWLPELVADIDSCHVIEGEDVEYRLQNGQVAVVFDLSRTVHAGRAAIGSMLSDARLRLFKELEQFEGTLEKKREQVPKIRKPRRDKLLHRLRLCDALNAKATDDEIILVLYPSYSRKGKLPTGDERAQVVRKIKDDKRVAVEMMEVGYLTLVPLDYLQDKSSRKKTQARHA